MISKFKNLNLLYINSIPTFLQIGGPPPTTVGFVVQYVCIIVGLYYGPIILKAERPI